MDLDDQVVECVGTQPVAWWNDGCRTVLGDDRRTEERVAGIESGTIVDRRVVDFSIEEHGLMCADGLASIAIRDRLAERVERLEGSNHTNAGIHNLHCLAFPGKAIAAAMEIVKGGQKVSRERDIQLVSLPPIAKIDRTHGPSLQLVGAKLGVPMLFESSKHVLTIGIGREHDGAREIANGVGQQDAHGGKRAGQRGNQHTRNAQRVSE